MDDEEIGSRVGPDGMAVDLGWRSMGCPASVSNGYLRNEGLMDVDGGCSNLLAETGDLADLLEVENFTGLVAVDAYTSRIITTVFLAC